MDTAILIASSASCRLHRHAHHFALAVAQRTSLRMLYFIGRSADILSPEHALLLLQWKELAHEHKCKLYLCSNGVTTAEMTKGTTAALQDIEIIGHATWIALSSDVDRVFSFPDGPL